jgi:hypothetical protein
MPRLNLCKKFLQTFRVIGSDFQQVGAIPRYCVTFKDLLRRGGMLEKIPEMLGGIDGHYHESRNILPQKLMINLGKVTLDDTGIFKFAQAFAGSWKGKTDFFGQIVASGSAVLLQNFQNLNINIV